MHGIHRNLAGLLEWDLIVMFVESLQIMQFSCLGCAPGQSVSITRQGPFGTSQIHVLVAKTCPWVLKI